MVVTPEVEATETEAPQTECAKGVHPRPLQYFLQPPSDGIEVTSLCGLIVVNFSLPQKGAVLASYSLSAFTRHTSSFAEKEGKKKSWIGLLLFDCLGENLLLLAYWTSSQVP